MSTDAAEAGDREATPSGVVIVARTPSGDVNITEGVMCLYDLVIQSMDWGSGFLSVEEAIPVVHVARTCGFANWEEAQRYVDAQAHSEEQQRFLRERNLSPWSSGPHEHLFSSVGRCMWPRCTVTESETRDTP